MADANNRVKITDFTTPIINTRERYLLENDNKIKGRKGFLFGSFKTEKERIQKAIEDNSLMMGNSLEQTKLRNENKTLKKNLSVSPLKGDRWSTGCYQPQMRFKPRTDLERIYDSVNLNYYGKIDQGVINRQLKQLDLNVPKASLSCDINDDDNNKTLNNNKVGNADFPSHLIKDTKREGEHDVKKKKTSKKVNKPKILYRRPLNRESKKIMNDFHYKTHFKALESLAINPTQIVTNRNISRSKDENDNFTKDFAKEEKSEVNPIDIIESGNYSNYIHNRAYYYSRNPLLKKSLSQSDYNNINLLHKIAFKSDENESKHKQSIKLQEEEFRKEDYRIKLGNEVLYMNNQMGLIANKILTRCNVFHQKNKNNNVSLKAGNGKLMMTRGMPLNKFIEKYNLK